MTDHDPSDDPFDAALAKRFEVLDSVDVPDNWPGRGAAVAAPRRRWFAAAAAVAVLAASLGWASTRSDEGDVIAVGNGGSTTTVPATAPTTVPVSDCPVTQPPAEPFVPPEPWASEPSSSGEVWFGDDDLWTVLDTDGHVARKSVWWSANFPGGGVEPVPEIAVIYERLDAPGQVVDLGPEGTNANTAADGWFMIAGGGPATPGCWQATATYKGATLSYVYEVPESAGSTECHDPRAAAAVMAGTSNVEYDYQGSVSPAELVASADHVVVGRVSGVGVEDGQAWIELSDLAPDSGLGAVVRVGYEFFATASADIDAHAIVGVRALAVLYDNDAAIGGLEVSLEGLWFSCSDDAVAYPAKLIPTRDGWPVEPSINQLIDLIADPPVLVDGPVVRRSGQRSFADAQFEFLGDPADGTDALSIDGGCSWFVGGGGRTAIVWPPGTEHDDGVVTFASGESVESGAVLGFTGVMLDASLVRYEIGLAAGEAIETCVDGVSDAPVLVLDTVEVAEPSQSPADADRDGVVGALAALRNSDRIAPLVEAPASEGTWALSQIPADQTAVAPGEVLGDPTGEYPVDHVYPFEYGEVLLLDDDGRIIRAYPMPGAVPSWLLVTDEAILAGRIGDGGLPDSTFVRIDRGTLDAEVLLIPAPFDGGATWPPSWRIATPEEVELFDTAVGFAPQGASGTAAVSWIGDVVVDLDRLAALADSAFS